MVNINVLNLCLSAVVFILGIMGYVKNKKTLLPLLIAFAYLLFGISHLAYVLGKGQIWGTLLVEVRTIGYLIMVYALTIEVVKP
jgi:NADH:ubiquinone oxidoreductase subunit K